LIKTIVLTVPNNQNNMKKKSYLFKISYLLNRKTLLSIISLLTLGLSTVKAQSPYCDPQYGSQSGNCTTYYMSINALEITQGSTTLYSRAHNTYGYNGCNASSGQYTLMSSSSMFTLKAGATYKFGFTTGTTYPVNIMIWLDLNADNDFSDANEFLTVPTCVYAAGNVPNGTSSLTYFNVKIPTGVTPGTSRMRIRSTYYNTTCPGSTDAGCTNFNYGEAEDYTVTLASDPNDGGITAITTPLCGPAVSATISNLGNNDINPVQVGWSVDGSYQTPNTYSTVIKPGASANITLSPNYNFVDGNTYKVKVFTYSPNNTNDADRGNDTSVISFKYQGPSGTPTTYDAVKCGPGKAPLKATTSFATDSVVWYNAASGGNVVARGKNTLSPSLFLGVNNFWAQSFKIGSPSKLANGMSGTTILSGSFSAYNGAMVDITPTSDIVVDSFAIDFYQNYANSTYEIYYKTGTYVGNEKTATAWTLLRSGVSRVASVSGKNRGYLKIPETALKGGVTYGFYITTTPTTGNDLFATYGTSTYSNSDLSVTGGSYIYGLWASTGIYQPYNIDLETYYRKQICPSSRVPIKITVNPSPNGAGFTKGTPFQTTQPNTLGVVSNPDIVAKGDQITWELTPPTGYSNSGYGSTWLTMTPVVKSKKGITCDPKYWSYTAPSGSTPGKFTFSPDKDIVDSFYIVSLQIKDLGPYYCDSTILRHIFVAPRPEPNFKFNSPICDGDAVLFTDLSKISSGVLTYKWDFNTGNPADTATVATNVFKFPSFGTYNVSLTTTSMPYGYKETMTIPVVVTEIPKISFKVLNACEKVAVSFNNTTTIGAGTVTYAWDFGDPSTTLDKSTAKNPTWTYTNAGAYKVTLRATASGCTAELSKNANQFAVPTAKFTAPGLICDKSDVQFTNGSTIKMGNMGYTWDFGDGGVSNFANPIHQFANATTKQVKMKAVSEFGCVDSMIKTITLSEAPKPDFTWGAACNLTNTNFTFTGTKPSGALTTFNWNFAGEGSTTLENPSKLFSITGRKNVTLTMVSNNGCSNSITKEVNVKLQSKADFISGDVCEDDDAVFTNKSTVSQGNLIYNWKFGDATTSGSQSPRHRYNIGGISQTYNVTLVAVVPGGCSDSISKQVSVNAKPKSDFTFTTSGRQVSFAATQAGNTLYQWRFGDGGSSNSATTKYDYLNFASGKYQACLAVVNAAGCFSETCKAISISGGVDKLNKLSGVKIYPNPNKGNFTVTVEDPKSDISIGVYNLLGEVVKTVETTSLKSTYSIDLNVANGVYLVKVTNGGLTSTQKVTINR
jgi:PKD repeat protein